MAKATGARERAEEMHRGTAALLAAWLEEQQELLRDLIALRALGAGAQEAVQAVLELPKVRVARLSWKLWASFTAADGVDPEALLLQHASPDLMCLGTKALFGSRPRPDQLATCGASLPLRFAASSRIQR